MNLKFINPGIEYMIESIMAFQTEESTAFWSEPLYHFYPQIDKAHATSLSFEDRKKYIEECLRKIYPEVEKIINDKIVLYSDYWNQYKDQISEALSDAFDIDCSKLFNNMTCKVSMNPISPRFLEEQEFEVFYLNSERGALGASMHEIIHFVWFYVWHELYKDSYDEYETPSMKWILSEMVGESVTRDKRLSSINPYFPREHGGCIYPYFFTMKADGKYVLDVLDNMYKSQNIKEFMKNSYAYCLEHENEIRKHIEESEKQ